MKWNEKNIIVNTSGGTNACRSANNIEGNSAKYQCTNEYVGTSNPSGSIFIQMVCLFQVYA